MPHITRTIDPTPEGGSMSKQPTLKQFQTWAKEHASLALTVCKAQAMAELKRKKVDAYIKPVFDSFHFEQSPTLDSKPITNPKELYLCTDEEKVTAYYAACDAIHKTKGE